MRNNHRQRMTENGVIRRALVTKKEGRERRIDNTV